MAESPTEKPFVFICGADDFLVSRAGKARYEELAKNIDDEFSREVISGFANNGGEVADAINRFREGVQTISMFGGRRVVWFKDVNFLADSVTGRAEGTLKLVEDLQQILASINPAEVAVVVSAAPVDRRRSFPKWCEKTGEFLLIGGDGEGTSDALTSVATAEAQTMGAKFGEGALQMLLARVGSNTRLLIEEVRKLATFVGGAEAANASNTAGKPFVIEESHVEEITPNVAEGDFFESAEAFFAGNLRWTLEALHRHFYAGGHSRPILSALQNRNRILIQVRALVDSGEAKLGGRGLDGLASAAKTYATHFTGATEKNSYNIFTQNPWYVGKLAGGGKALPPLRRLIDNQQEFIRAFEEVIQRPNEQEDVLRDMVVRCLSTGA